MRTVVGSLDARTISNSQGSRCVPGFFCRVSGRDFSAESSAPNAPVMRLTALEEWDRDPVGLRRGGIARWDRVPAGSADGIAFRRDRPMGSRARGRAPWDRGPVGSRAVDCAFSSVRLQNVGFADKPRPSPAAGFLSLRNRA